MIPLILLLCIEMVDMQNEIQFIGKYKRKLVEALFNMHSCCILSYLIKEE